MNRNDWYETGDQIKKLVQDAVDSKDFSQLSNTISKVVDQTVDGFQAILKESLNANQQGGNGSGFNTAGGTSGRDNPFQDMFGSHGRPHGGSDYTNREAAERIRRRMQEKRQAGTQTRDRELKPVKAKLKVPGEITGKVMKWYGYSVGSMLGLSWGILAVIGIATGFPIMVPVGILALLFGVHMCIGAGGSRRLKIAKRFRKYNQVLGERTYCLVEELANSIGESTKFVRKDLKKMISRGYFKEGYLDGKETLLITDKSTYQQYLTTQTEYERRTLEKEQQEKARKVQEMELQEKTRRVQEKEQQESAHRARESAQSSNAENAAAQPIFDRKNLSPECRELIEEGERYIQHVHECNERIPDDEMSAKLDRLELVITRIFREAAKDPEVVPELKKMMSYYLPTTRKLLDAYCEMDAQPIRGQNIENTKKEIENALDTINLAFENLLDSFFEETAWDISSDISVLNTMLAQEGLTGNDFGRK